MEKPQKGSLEAKLLEDFHGFELQIDKEYKDQPLTIDIKAIIYLSDKLSPNNLLRVSVVGGGCSGLSYGFSAEDKISFNKETDRIVLDDPLVIVDVESLQYLPGSKIILENNIYGNRLAIENPAAVQTCGCGESFSVNYE